MSDTLAQPMNTQVLEMPPAAPVAAPAASRRRRLAGRLLPPHHAKRRRGDVRSGRRQRHHLCHQRNHRPHGVARYPRRILPCLDHRGPAARHPRADDLHALHDLLQPPLRAPRWPPTREARCCTRSDCRRWSPLVCLLACWQTPGERGRPTIRSCLQPCSAPCRSCCCAGSCGWFRSPISR